MKKRLHDKKAGIAILLVLIAISLIDVIFRAVAIGTAVLNTSNVGEQLAVIALAVIILILTAKGKDRACYICYGAWLGYFVLDQFFEIPGTIVNMFAPLTNGMPMMVVFQVIIRTIIAINIVAIGVLLVEYMNDGTIYNRAFNGLCIATLSLLAVAIVFSVLAVINDQPIEIMLSVFNNLSRATMVFLFTSFAYDSAKAQLKKSSVSKCNLER